MKDSRQNYRDIRVQCDNITENTNAITMNFATKRVGETFCIS